MSFESESCLREDIWFSTFGLMLRFGLFHGGDHIASLLQHRVTEGPLCVFLGWGTVYAMVRFAFFVSVVLSLAMDHS